MPRILLICSDAVFGEMLRESILFEGDCEVCVETIEAVETTKKTIDLLPDLVMLEMEMSLINNPQISEALKLGMTELPVFLITDHYSMEAEKEALSWGMDAVFEKDHDFSSLVMNARAVCGLT